MLSAIPVVLVFMAMATTGWTQSSTQSSQYGNGNNGNGNGCARAFPAMRPLQLALNSGRSDGNKRIESPNVGDDRGSGWDCVRGCIFRLQPWSTMWPGSRVISAQKANTANSFSLDSSSASNGSGAAAGLSLSTANLYSAVQPGGSLFGLQESNPVDTGVAYAGPSSNYGEQNDPMVGQKIGGVNVFGGGLGLYATGKKLVGAIGLSGDTSCADHDISWRVRKNLGFDHLLGIGGVSGDANRPDNIIYDITPNPSGGTGVSAGGFGHPKCISTLRIPLFFLPLSRKAF